MHLDPSLSARIMAMQQQRGSGSGGGGASALLQRLADMLQPVRQRPGVPLRVVLRYHYKYDGSETRAAAQDALLAACHALQPSHLTIDVRGRHAGSSQRHVGKGQRRGKAAAVSGDATEEAAWLRFARELAAALPTLQSLRDTGFYRRAWRWAGFHGWLVEELHGWSQPTTSIATAATPATASMCTAFEAARLEP